MKRQNLITYLTDKKKKTFQLSRQSASCTYYIMLTSLYVQFMIGLDA